MDLHIQNRYVLDLVQALIGAVTPNFREVGIRFNDPVVLCFLLERDSDEDSQEIDDVLFEFRALQDDPLMKLALEVVVSAEPRSVARGTRPDRVVFCRKESEHL